MSTFASPDGTFFSEAGGQPVSVVNPTTSSTIAMAWNQRDLYVANSATLAALTILLPMKVLPGAKVEIGCESAITALTIHDGFGNAITGAPTAGAAGSAIVMRYVVPPLNLAGVTAAWVHWK